MKPIVWLKIVFGSVACAITFCIYTVFYIDPYGIYSERRVFHADLRGSIVGVIKNASFDSAIIGSSMAQNFNMQQVQADLNWHAVKLTIGGLSLDDLGFILENLKNRPIKNLVIILDIHIFNSTSKEKVKFFEFLGDKQIWNDLPYWFSYDLWLKTFPKNFLRQIVSFFGKSKTNPEFLEIEKLGDWGGKFVFGREIVKENYLNGKYGVSPQNPKDMLFRMKNKFDCFFSELTKNFAQQRVIFLFPPYSALYWLGTMKDGSFDNLMNFKIYCMKKISEFNGAYCAFDFQTMEIVSDLDYYKDPTHYKPLINDLMVNCLKTGKFKTNTQKTLGEVEKLKKLVSKLVSRNSDWLKR
ncbi:MAG: hypothetical protein C0412_02530 [Flavobacterium sp.]|nr:hypothetical protein [Flavobacterium sp.]